MEESAYICRKKTLTSGSPSWLLPARVQIVIKVLNLYDNVKEKFVPSWLKTKVGFTLINNLLIPKEM